MGFVRECIDCRLSWVPAPAAERFWSAFPPNMFRRFFAEGAFTWAFGADCSLKRLEAGDDPEKFAKDGASDRMAFILTCSPSSGSSRCRAGVVDASGFAAGTNGFDLAGRIRAYWRFPYILFILLAPSVSGVADATGDFMAAQRPCGN